MVEFRPAGLGVWFWVGFGAFVPFSTICLFFPSFNDDLGTMPTRRPYSRKKYLYLFVQNWKCRTSTKGTKVPPGHPALPLSTTRLWNEELRLSLLLAHCIANGEKRLLTACASCLPLLHCWLAYPPFQTQDCRHSSGLSRSPPCDDWLLSTRTGGVFRLFGHKSLTMCIEFPLLAPSSRCRRLAMTLLGGTSYGRVPMEFVLARSLTYLGHTLRRAPSL